MAQKSRKPHIRLVTKNRLSLTTCKPELEEGCAPGAGPGFNYSDCKPTIIKCVPASGPGKN